MNKITLLALLVAGLIYADVKARLDFRAEHPVSTAEWRVEP